MSDRVGKSSHGDSTQSPAAKSSATRQAPLSLRKILTRSAVAAAFGFNISGLADIYVAGKSLRNYLRDTGTFSLPQFALDSAVYIFSGILLTVGFYFFLQRMTSTANGARSPVQKSKPLRYASIALCGLWATQDRLSKAVDGVTSYTSNGAVTLPGALYEVCGTLLEVFVMGSVYYKFISKAFAPPRQRSSPSQTHGDTQQPEVQLA